MTINPKRIGMLVAMMSSPVDGEALAALRACTKELKRIGMDWNDVAAMISSSASARWSPRAWRRGPAPRPPKPAPPRRGEGPLRKNMRQAARQMQEDEKAFWTRRM
jgi:hypothetical protein